MVMHCNRLQVKKCKSFQLHCIQTKGNNYQTWNGSNTKPEVSPVCLGSFSSWKTKWRPDFNHLTRTCSPHMEPIGLDCFKLLPPTETLYDQAEQGLNYPGTMTRRMLGGCQLSSKVVALWCWGTGDISCMLSKIRCVLKQTLVFQILKPV